MSISGAPQEQGPSIGDEAERFLEQSQIPQPEDLNPELVASYEQLEANTSLVRQKLIEELKKAGLQFVADDPDEETDLFTITTSIQPELNGADIEFDRNISQTDETLDSVNEEISAILRQSEILYFIDIFANYLCVEDRDMLIEKLALLSVTDKLGSEDKNAFMEALENVIGNEEFGALVNEVFESGQIEIQRNEEANIALREAINAVRKTKIEASLIEEFGLGSKVNHDDWEKFVSSIHQYDVLKKEQLPGVFLENKMQSIVACSDRLGINPQVLEQILDSIGG